MITYKDALKIIETEGKILGTEIIHTAEIVARILAEDIHSPIAIQPFDNSAMDGFALCAEDIQNATAENPIKLQCLGKIAAGEAPPQIKTNSGECWEIMTGAIMPKDCDSVVPIENIMCNQQVISYSNSCVKNSHVRFKGEDFQKGDTVLPTGTLMTSEHILVLATLGIHQVLVHQKIKIALISTGKEVINDLQQPLEIGQIYNSTGPYILSVLQCAHVDVKSYGTLPDKEEDFAPLIDKISKDKVHLIISTGAVSAGKHDFIKPSLLEIGAHILFHKVYIRPGKPNLFAKLKNGILFFGLPGNPAATVAGLRFFVSPLIRHFQGQSNEEPIQAELTNDISSKEGFKFFLKAKLSHKKSGQLQVTILKGQKSFMVQPFTQANAWAIVPESKTTLRAGDIVNIYPFSHKKLILNHQKV